jgi:hypothetical protein
VTTVLPLRGVADDGRSRGAIVLLEDASRDGDGDGDGFRRGA